MTDNKSKIVQIIKEKGPISAPEIMQLFKNDINKTTIYRNLSSMINDKVIRKVRVDTQKDYYELANLPHHHHFICESCGIIKEVKDESLENKISNIERELKNQGMNIKRHDVEFYGNCINCI